MKIKFMTEYMDSNSHGTQAEGKPWNEQTVKGPKFKLLKLNVHLPSTAWRLIYYYPDGGWRNWDMYIDRRPKEKTDV